MGKTSAARVSFLLICLPFSQLRVPIENENNYSFHLHDVEDDEDGNDEDGIITWVEDDVLLSDKCPLMLGSVAVAVADAGGNELWWAKSEEEIRTWWIDLWSCEL